MPIMKCPRIVYTDLNGLFCKVLDGPLMSADDLSRLEEEGRRDGQPQVLGGLEIDDEFEGCRPFHWQVGRFGAVQDAIDVVGRPLWRIGGLQPIRQEPTSRHK